MPLSIDAIRRLNQISIVAIDHKVPDETGIKKDAGVSSGTETTSTGGGRESFRVSFYTTTPLSMGSSVNMSETGGINSLIPAKIGGIVSAFSGYAPQLDIERRFAYQGTSPMKFDIKGYLLLDESAEKDYWEPILKLSYLAYPMRVNIMQNVEDWINKQADNLGAMLPGWAQTFLFGEGKPSDVLWDALGNPSLLKLPESLQRLNQAGIGGNRPYIVMRYGGMRFPSVIIRDFHAQIPMLYYEGGLPPYIEISMTVETLRTTSFDLMREITGI